MPNTSFTDLDIEPMLLTAFGTAPFTWRGRIRGEHSLAPRGTSVVYQALLRSDRMPPCELRYTTSFGFGRPPRAHPCASCGRPTFDLWIPTNPPHPFDQRWFHHPPLDLARHQLEGYPVSVALVREGHSSTVHVTAQLGGSPARVQAAARLALESWVLIETHPS